MHMQGIPYLLDQRPRLLNVSFCCKRRLQFERVHFSSVVLITHPYQITCTLSRMYTPTRLLHKRFWFASIHDPCTGERDLSICYQCIDTGLLWPAARAHSTEIIVSKFTGATIWEFESGLYTRAASDQANTVISNAACTAGYQWYNSSCSFRLYTNASISKC